MKIPNWLKATGVTILIAAVAWMATVERGVASISARVDAQEKRNDQQTEWLRRISDKLDRLLDRK